jgi:hypothetical protein
MFRKVFLSALLATGLGGGMLTGVVHADTVNVLEIFAGSGTDTLTGGDGPPSGLKGEQSTVSAQVTFSYDVTTSQLVIDITNTTAQNQLLGNDDALTQMAFRLTPGLTLGAGSASGQTATWMNTGGAGTFSATNTNPPPNLGADWGGGGTNGVVPSETEYQLLSNAHDNALVTSFTDDLLNTSGHSFTSFTGAGLGSGTNYGVIPQVSGPVNADNFSGNNPYTWGMVEIKMAVSGPVTAADISGINFIFGAADTAGVGPNAIVPGSPVPLPSVAPTCAVLLSGVAGFGFFRKRAASLK